MQPVDAVVTHSKREQANLPRPNMTRFQIGSIIAGSLKRIGSPIWGITPGKSASGSNREGKPERSRVALRKEMFTQPSAD